MHRNGATYDDVRPDFIGLREEHSETYQCNNYCLCDRLANPVNANVAQYNHYHQGDNFYMSPNLWRGVTRGQKHIEHDSKKSDAWSLGMTILEAGNGHEVQKVYDRESKDISEKHLHENLHQFKDRYGHENPLLCDVVENLLQVNEDKRLGCVQLLEQIPPYSDVNSYIGHEHKREHAEKEVMEHVKDVKEYHHENRDHHDHYEHREHSEHHVSNFPKRHEEVVVSSQKKPDVVHEVRRSYKTSEFKPTAYSTEGQVVRREYVDSNGNVYKTESLADGTLKEKNTWTPNLRSHSRIDGTLRSDIETLTNTPKVSQPLRVENQVRTQYSEPQRVTVNSNQVPYQSTQVTSYAPQSSETVARSSKVVSQSPANYSNVVRTEGLVSSNNVVSQQYNPVLRTEGFVSSNNVVSLL